MLRALEDLLDRSVLDFDMYVGVSGGAFVTSLLANGISPGDLYHELLEDSSPLFGALGSPLFRLGAREIARRSARAPALLRATLARLMRGEGESAYDLLMPFFELLPSGLLDNSGIADFLATTFRERAGTDRFSQLARQLYLVAVDLDSGEAVAFGDRGRRDVPISKAVQASTALPGLYRPVRIGGRDYVDGGVSKTAHVNLAIGHGADLVICINPIVPIRNDARRPLLGGPLSHKGITYVLDQVLRILLHGRMQYGLERYRARASRGGHPAHRAAARRHAHVRLQHHARRGAAHGGAIRLSLGDGGVPRHRPAGVRAHAGPPRHQAAQQAGGAPRGPCACAPLGLVPATRRRPAHPRDAARAALAALSRTRRSGGARAGRRSFPGWSRARFRRGG